MEDVKKVIGVLIKEFTQEESGNRVTSNNMSGLQLKIMMAIDGKISLNPADKDNKEGNNNAYDHNRPLYRHGGEKNPG